MLTRTSKLGQSTDLLSQRVIRFVFGQYRDGGLVFVIPFGFASGVQGNLCAKGKRQYKDRV